MKSMFRFVALLACAAPFAAAADCENIESVIHQSGKGVVTEYGSRPSTAVAMAMVCQIHDKHWLCDLEINLRKQILDAATDASKAGEIDSTKVEKARAELVETSKNCP
jgi:hypothetical protein